MAANAPVEVPKGEPTAEVSGLFEDNIEMLWKVVSGFDDLNTWWPIYKDWTCDGDVIGSIRAMTLPSGPRVTEKLVGRDPQKYMWRYDLVSMTGSPLPVKKVSTVMSLTSQGNSTLFKFRSWTEASALSLITPAQKSGYETGISCLRRYLHPSLGKAAVKIIGVNGLPNEGAIPCVGSGWRTLAYAEVVVDGCAPHMVRAAGFGASPEFKHEEPIDFEILKPDSRLKVGVFKASPGIDTQYGCAYLNIQKECENGKTVTRDIKLDGCPGASVKVQVEITLKDNSKTLPLSKAQAAVQSLTKMQESLELLKKRAMDIYTLASEDEPPSWSYDRKGALPKCVSGLPASEILPPHKIAVMIERVTEFMYTQFSLTKRLPAVANSYDRYSTYFANYKGNGEGYVPCPVVLKNNIWADDEEFLRQVFSGLNPMQVEVCTDASNFPPQLTALKSKDGATVEELIKQDRLYSLDYPSLRDLDLTINGGKLYAPTVLLYRTGGEQLNILGIVLEPKRAGAPVYTPDSDVPNKYLLAKLHVACADNQVHQFTYHLGFAHLATEPLAVCCHNALERNDHPLGWFLKPHFRDTIGINYLARQTLVADQDAITDATFAVGTAQGVKMVVEGFQSYDFITSGLPDELARRGFKQEDSFKGYRYRDDGMLIWNALLSLSKDMVDQLYKSDADVAADKVIQEWCVEGSSAEKADIRGFPKKIDSKELLVKTLTTIMWTASALHSALNYDQYPYTATPINRPASLLAGVPDGPGDITEADILKAVPGGMDQFGVGLALFQGLLSWLLATPEPPTLTQVSDAVANKNNPQKLVDFRAKYPEVYKKFDQTLAQVESTIDKKNAGLKMPYTVLRPSQVAASINI